MTKPNNKALLILSLLMIAITKPASADLKKDPSVLISGVKNAPKAAKTDISDPSVVDTFAFDKKAVRSTEKTLRCWQDGVMIVAEHDWNLAAVQAPILVNKKAQRAYAFNYSDTFCLYIGG